MDEKCSPVAGQMNVRDPQQYITEGLWEVEPLYYSTGASKALRRGKAYKSLESDEFVCFQGHDGCIYRIGDNVYLDSQQPELAYFICGIQGFKMTKRDQLHIKVNWYYRPTEVPETVYHTLVQDRHTEHSENDTELCIKDPKVRCRELFISDAQDSYPISTLRGKCVIRHYKDIVAAREFKPELDTFFYILGYNPENNRLANIQGEIRVGSSHQAKLPELRRPDDGVKPYQETGDGESRETTVWTPNLLADSELKMFLWSARSMAAFAGICDGTTEDGYLAATKDSTTTAALESLHQNRYNVRNALNHLVNKPAPPAETKWTEDETKKFVKGLKQWGKNFYKIRRELLQHRTTGQLVEFYYLWKKSPAALNQRPRQRQRRPQANILRRIKPTNNGNNKPSRPASSEFLDLESASENEGEEREECEQRDLVGYACHHCYCTVSKDWHHAGKDRALLCTDCRLYFKKYGELRAVDRPRTPPPYLFKPVRECEFLDDFGVRTRAGKASAGKDLLIGAKRRTMTPTADMECPRKSPSAVSTSSTSSVQSTGATESVKTGRKRNGKHKRKRTRRAVAEEEAGKRKRQKRSTDRSESESSADSAPTSPNENEVEDNPLEKLPKTEPASVYEFREENDENQKLASPEKSKEQIPVEADEPQTQSVIQVNPVKQEVEDEEYEDAGTAKESEPVIDDSVFLERQNGHFKRHWNREPNSCARTDLTFVYVPKPRPPKADAQSKSISVKQEPRSERPATAGSAAPSLASPQQSAAQTPFPVPMSLPGMPVHGFPAMVSTAFGQTPDLPALQRLRMFAEHSQQMVPGSPAFQQAAILDPHIQQRVLAGHFGEQQRQWLELAIQEQRQEQLKRDFEVAAKTAMGPQGHNPLFAAELQRFGAPGMMHAAAAANDLNRVLGLPQSADPAVVEQHLQMNRAHLERLAPNDPIARMQLEQLIALSQYHTHSHTHSHTHLHIHPSVAGNNVPLPADALLQPYGPRAPMVPPQMGFHPMDPMEQARLAMAAGGGPMMHNAEQLILADRMRQEQNQRALAFERAQQNNAVAMTAHLNDMMRRLQQEGNASSLLNGMMPH